MLDVRSDVISPVRCLIPPDLPRDAAAAGADIDDSELAEIYRYPHGQRWVRANFIATVDGAAQGPDQRSGSISGRADRRLLALLRALSDVILVGAGTARIEGYAPADIRPTFAPLRERLGLPPTPPIAVVTDSLDIPRRLLEDPRTMVITSEASEAVRRAHLAQQVDVVVAGPRRVEAATALDALADRGFRRILCEGGPSLLRLVAGGGLLDELCLTTSPELLGGPALRIIDGPSLPAPMRLELATLLEEDGFLFARWLPA